MDACYFEKEIHILRSNTASKHLFRTQDLSKDLVYEIIERAAYFELTSKDKLMIFPHRVVANLFFEPSTRTRSSFEIAEKRLGMHVIQLDKRLSSMEKGESLYDTVKTLAHLETEVVVIRHPESRVIADLIDQPIGCSVINAGTGIDNHPTQALLDLYTMKKHFKKIEGLRVAIVGDVLHSRVAQSNIDLLRKFGVEVVLSGPESGVKLSSFQEIPFHSFNELLPQVDVVMLLRVQFEKHQQAELIQKEGYLQRHGLTMERIKRMKTGAIIMHPGPVNRGVEICSELVEHPKSKIFEQMKNGLYIRMACLEYVLGGL